MATDNLDPHAGLADLDAEDDVAQLVASVRSAGTASGDPLKRAAQTLRAGSDEAEQADEAEPTETDEDADETAGVEAGTEQEETKATDEEAEGEEETEEGEEEAEPEKPKGFTLEVPVLARRGEHGGEQKWLLEELPQEVHDALKGHLNRSAQLDSVTQDLQAAREQETMAQFVERHPVPAMLMLDQRDRDSGQPKGIGAQFVELWMAQNPKDALAIVRRMKYDDPEALDEEGLQVRAERAQLKAEKAVNGALLTTKQDTARRQWADDAGRLIRAAALEAGISGEDATEFYEVAAARINGEAQHRRDRGQSPLLSRAEVLKQLEKALRRYVTPAAPAGKVNGKGTAQPEDVAKKFAAREARAAKTRKLGGGRSALPPAGLSISMKKLKGAKDVKAAAAVLRESGP